MDFQEQLAVRVDIAIHQASLMEALQATNSPLEAPVKARTQKLVAANAQLREENPAVPTSRSHIQRHGDY
jgi:hypothetical protein